MKEFKKNISLDEIFGDNYEKAVNSNDYLSSLCKKNVRTGKWFLCYC